MVPAIATLVVGLIVGYLAQRSRMCFIGGLRDFILVRDTELLKGVGAFFITAWLAFSLAGYIGLLDLQAPQYQGISPNLLQRATTDEATNAKVAGHAAPTPVRLSQGLLTIGWPILLLTVGAGVVIGLFTTLANGCPTRQHVLAAQGMQDAMFYLAGFYLGVIFYYLVTKPLLSLFI
jgi:uncharacterized membrane protein YedE/YeeE